MRYKYVYAYCILKDKNGVPLIFCIVCELGISVVPLFSWTIEFIFVRVSVAVKKSLHQVRREDTPSTDHSDVPLTDLLSSLCSIFLQYGARREMSPSQPFGVSSRNAPHVTRHRTNSFWLTRVQVFQPENLVPGIHVEYNRGNYVLFNNFLP